MSCKVRIFCEDIKHDEFILKPLVERLMKACELTAKVDFANTPAARGYESVVDWIKKEGVEKYKYQDLLLFLPDADGKDCTAQFAALEAQALQAGTTLLCCAAKEEVETWLLAGHLSKLDMSWQTVRSDTSVKENVFAPFLSRYGNLKTNGEGRQILMRETLENYSGLLARCPELADLEQRICKHFLTR